MDGIQRTLYEGLGLLREKVQEGVYGTDDDIDADAFREDMDGLEFQAE